MKSAPMPQFFPLGITVRSSSLNIWQWKLSTDLTAREDALGRNKALLRLWISKNRNETNCIISYLAFNSTILSFCVASQFTLGLVLFKYSISLKNYHWDATPQVLLAKSQRQNWIEELFLKTAKDFRVFEVLWHVLYSYIVKMKCYFLKSQILQAVFQVNDFHRKYILNII